MSNQAIDWSLPQRQSPAALFIISLKVFRATIKILWPLLLIYFVRGQKSNVEYWNILFVSVPAFLLIRSVLEFMVYRFYIVNDELTIKKGILRKQTIAIPLEKIQAVHIERSFIHNFLGTARISFDSPGTEKTEVNIDAVEVAKAESLKGFILKSGSLDQLHEQKADHDEKIVELTSSDLLKLSLSSNHFEAFFILLGFLFSIFENVKELMTDQLNKLFNQTSDLLVNNTIQTFLFLFIFSLVLSVIISTGKTFLTYFNFYVSRTEKGFRIHSGLLNVKEKVVPFKKIQYVSWKANWLRRKIGLYLLHFHSTGTDEMKQRLQVKVPVTKYASINTLTLPYSSLSQAYGGSVHFIHPSYAIRRLIYPGSILFLVAFFITVPWWHWNSLWFLLILPYTYITAYLFVRHFRLSLTEESMMIHRGVFGMEEILLKWRFIQKITMIESIYQRKHQLATLKIHTAGGIIIIPFVTLALAAQIYNYSLYKVEGSPESWM